jgi:hypothetical protein
VGYKSAQEILLLKFSFGLISISVLDFAGLICYPLFLRGFEGFLAVFAANMPANKKTCFDALKDVM